MASLSDDEETNEQKLLSFARHGDVDGLKSLLVHDTELPNGDLELPVSTCNVNCKGTSKATRGWAPLHLTCYFGHHDATEILLKHGADIDVMNDTGDTPLHKAVYTSRLDIVMLLLQHNAKIDILNAEGLSVKQMAKDSEIKCLLEAVEGVSQQRQEHDYLSAVRTGSADAVKHVLNSSMQLNINCTDFFGNTALHIASSRGYKEVAVLLLQVAVDSNVKNIKGQTAIDVCHSEQMRDLLDVKPLRELQKIVQRYEAPLMKKSRVLGWKPYWVVLERGVISFFKNRADACTGVRRKTFRYLDNAKVKSSLSDYHSFTVYCSNGSQLKLAVTETNNAALHRQRWENALSSHVTYSNSFLRCGVSDDNDDDNDIISVGSMMDTLQTCQAYQQLLSQHVAHTRQSINNFTARTVPSALQVELLKVHQGLHDVSNTSQAMCSSLTHCLSVITQQEHLRKRQLEQEVERSRVLQDALHVLAQENHTLEKRVSAGHKSPRKPAPGNSTERINQSPTLSDNHMTDDMDQSDDSEIDDLFYDCDNVHIDNELNKALTLSTNQNNCSNEQPITNSLTNGANNELPNEEVEVKSKWNGRTRLPVPMISRNDFSVWSILRQCIGKELSKITMPVVFNEPLSFVQRVVEYMEYATLLQKACECNDPVQRMEYVTAFAVSMSASNWDRLGKPFNPLLGETYELERDDLGFKIVCEQVCHHPPVSAFHAEGEDFSFHGAIHPKLKFWGRSVEIQPKGIVTLHLKPFDEVYTWNNVNCCVHNIIVGKLWIEHYGTMDIVNHRTKHKMSLNFKGHGWTGKDLHKVEGFIYDDKKNKLRALYGKWIEGLYSYDMHTWDTYTALKAQGQDVELPPTTPGEATESIPIKGSSCDLNLSNQRCLWVAEPRPPNSQNYYCFTMYAMMLNELRDEDKAKLPPTDSRLRPDINRLEEGDLDGAAEHKHCLEEKQRHSKKERKKRKEEWVPRWFQLDTNPHTGKEDWIFTNEYWRRNWSRCPDVF